MKERPILFSAPLVRAILAGTKTQTRRLITSVAGKGQVSEVRKTETRGYDMTFRDLRGRWNDMLYTDFEKRSPYGKAGDRLWVREAFSPRNKNGGEASTSSANFVVLRDGGQVYRDGEVVSPLESYHHGAFDGVKFRPSIHMPRWASRITLEVTGVRAERLQDISEEDAMAEGVDSGWPHRSAFASLWDRINGKREGASWEANPYVWVVEFRMVT